MTKNILDETSFFKKLQNFFLNFIIAIIWLVKSLFKILLKK